MLVSFLLKACLFPNGGKKEKEEKMARLENKEQRNYRLLMFVDTDTDTMFGELFDEEDNIPIIDGIRTLAVDYDDVESKLEMWITVVGEKVFKDNGKRKDTVDAKLDIDFEPVGNDNFQPLSEDENQGKPELKGLPIKKLENGKRYKVKTKGHEGKNFWRIKNDSRFKDGYCKYKLSGRLTIGDDNWIFDPEPRTGPHR